MISKSTNVLLNFVHPDGNHTPLRSNKILIGSASNCDIVIEDTSVSHYHAMIIMDEHGHANIMDLQSTNGIFINGEKTDKGFFGAFDAISIGTYHLQVAEVETEEIISNTDEAVENQTIEEKVYVPKPSREGQILIDDEYCDIVFDEENFKPVEELPLHQTSFSSQYFIDLEKWEETYDIVEESTDRAIRVTTLTNGNILDTIYLANDDGTYFASGLGGKGQIEIDLLDSKDKIAFIQIQSGKIQINSLENFKGVETSTTLGENNVIILTCGTYQVFIEQVKAPNDLKVITNLQKEKHFYKDAAKTFAAILFPMLLLLLVDFSIPKPPKKLSIIYRKPMKSDNNKKVASKTPSKTKQNTGHKSTKQKENKLKFAKAGAKKMPKKTVQKKVAKAKAAPKPNKKVAKAKAPVKSYQFKMANMKSMFAKTNNVSVTKSRAPAAIAAATSANVNTKINGTATGNAGTMGKDSRGTSSASYGTKGLSSIAGTDTAYIEPRTVILGSMDPELLRKILQEYLPQFRHCYQQELVHNSEDIKGIVDLNFEITGSGKVAKINIKAKDARFSKRGTNCMAKVLSVIDFPKPKGGGRVAVRQPLNFFSEKERG
jgi:pSer/pThr/pTyr-binding forkhead associated (FHA) protein